MGLWALGAAITLAMTVEAAAKLAAVPRLEEASEYARARHGERVAGGAAEGIGDGEVYGDGDGDGDGDGNGGNGNGNGKGGDKGILLAMQTRTQRNTPVSVVVGTVEGPAMRTEPTTEIAQRAEAIVAALDEPARSLALAMFDRLVLPGGTTVPVSRTLIESLTSPDFPVQDGAFGSRLIATFVGAGVFATVVPAAGDEVIEWAPRELPAVWARMALRFANWPAEHSAVHELACGALSWSRAGRAEAMLWHTERLSAFDLGPVGRSRWRTPLEHEFLNASRREARESANRTSGARVLAGTTIALAVLCMATLAGKARKENRAATIEHERADESEHQAADADVRTESAHFHVEALRRSATGHHAEAAALLRAAVFLESVVDARSPRTLADLLSTCQSTAYDSPTRAIAASASGTNLRVCRRTGEVIAVAEGEVGEAVFARREKCAGRRQLP